MLMRLEELEEELERLLRPFDPSTEFTVSEAELLRASSAQGE